MKTLVGVVLLVLLVGVSPSYAQLIQGGSSGSGVSTFSSGTEVPATCTPGDLSANGIFIDTSTGLFYFCEATDTLTQVNPAEADTLDTAFDRGKTIDSANNFANSFRVLDANGDGFAIYTDASDGPMFVCVDNNVENACTDYTRTLASGQTLVYKNSGGTAIFTLTESTGALTNVNYNTESTGNVFTYKKYKWIPAAGCDNATAGTVWDLPTSNAAVPACRTGTNTQKGVLEFADGSSLSAQYHDYLNEDWTGAIDAIVVYEANSTSTNNTVWQIAIACAGDGDADDPAFTDDEFTADAGKATAHQYNATAANTVTTTGSCAAGDIMHVRIKRDSAHASDTLAATAKLVGVSLKLREAQ